MSAVATPRRAVSWALAGLSLSTLMASLDTSIANAGLPTLARALGATFQGAQWIVLAYLLAVTTLIVSVGRLGDLVGRRRLLLLGISLFTVASVGCGLAPSLPVLLATRALQGVGAAVMMALTLAFVGETVPKERTGAAMGLLGTMSAVGTALGPSLGGALISGLGWRSIFLVNVPLGILNLALAAGHLPADRPRASKVEFDGVGTVLLALSLASYALAMTLGRVGYVLLPAAGVGIGLFVVAERRASSPLIGMAMLRNPVVSRGLAMCLLVCTVIMSTLVVGPFYLSGGLGLDAARVGLVMSVGPAVVALSSVPIGRLADRFGPGRMTLAGLGSMAVGCGLLAVLPMSLGVAGYLGPVVAITFGYAVFQTSNNAAVLGGVCAEERGVVSGMLNLSRNLGLITGASVIGAVFALGVGTDLASASPTAVGQGLHAVFFVATALIGIALLVRRRGEPALTHVTFRGGVRVEDPRSSRSTSTNASD